MKTFLTPSLVAIAVLLTAMPAAAQTPAAGSAVEAAYGAIFAHAKVIKTLEDIKADDARTLEEQKRITEIPGTSLQGKTPRRILPEAVSGIGPQGRFDRH